MKMIAMSIHTQILMYEYDNNFDVCFTSIAYSRNRVDSLLFHCRHLATTVLALNDSTRNGSCTGYTQIRVCLDIVPHVSTGHTLNSKNDFFPRVLENLVP